MESNRCGQTMEESSDVVQVIVRPDDPPLSQDVIVSSSSYCSSSSASRITENSLLPAVHFVTRTDFADCHMTSGMNRPLQLPVDNRRESWTQGESAVDNMTTVFSPTVPLSQDVFTPSTSLVSSSSLASLSRVVDNPRLSYTNVFTRPDFTGSHVIAGMNIPPQLPMDDRQASHGVPLVQDNSIASACFSTSSPSSTLSRVNDYSQSLPMGFIPRVDFRDTYLTSGVNISPQLPAMSAFRSSRASSTPAQSTRPMPRGSAVSLPIPRTCGVKFFDSTAFPLFSESLPTSADVMKLAGLLPQINNLISLHLNLNDCCAEAVTKLVFSITHKTLQTLKLRGIALTPDSAAALDRSVSEMSSLYELLIIGPEREPYEIEAPSPTLTSFKSSHFGTGSGWSFVLTASFAWQKAPQRTLSEFLG